MKNIVPFYMILTKIYKMPHSNRFLNFILSNEKKNSLKNVQYFCYYILFVFLLANEIT